MATITFASNTYAGEVLEDLLAYAVESNDTFEEGLIHIKPGIQKKFTLPHVSLGSIIQDNKPTPSSTEGGTGANNKNTYTFSERYLEPQDFMVYLEFNPRDYEEFWRPFQPDGELIFRELDPKVQATMLRLLISKKDEYINDCIWCSRKGGPDDAGIESDSESNVKLGGDTSAGPMKYFDGFLVRVITNVNSEDPNEQATGKVIIAGDTAMTTGDQVEKALQAMYRACPKNIRKSKKLRFVMDWDSWDLYDEYLSSKTYKYTDNTEVNKLKYKGIPIVPISGVPQNTIALGRFTNGADSCLWMGVDYASDQEAIKVDKLQNNSEMYFFQMRMKCDVNIVLPSEIVVWTTYKKKGE